MTKAKYRLEKKTRRKQALPSYNDNIDQNFYPQKMLCLGCLQMLDLGATINYADHNNLILPIETIQTKNNKFNLLRADTQLIQQSLCALLNNGLGYLFIGITSNYQVKGLQMDEDSKYNFVQNIKKIVRKFLMPDELKHLLKDSDQFDEVFQIRFIPVNIHSQSSAIANNLEVIRIKIDTTKKTNQQQLFFINTSKLGSETTDTIASYILKNGKALKIQNAELGQYIIAKFRQSSEKPKNSSILYTHSQKIRCRQSNPCKYSYKYPETIKKAQKKFLKAAKYNYQSLLVLNKESAFSLKELTKKLEQAKLFFQIEKIELQENSSRQIYYVSHQKNYEIFNKAINQINISLSKTKIPFLILNVRKQFVLLNFDDRFRAFDILSRQFLVKWQTNFFHGHKRVYKPKLKQQIFEYYFKFQTKEHSIFALSKLQEAKIKVNFVNQIKTEDTLWFLNSLY